MYMAEAATVFTARSVRCAGARARGRANCGHPAAPRRRRSTPRTVSFVFIFNITIDKKLITFKMKFKQNCCIFLRFQL